MILLVTLENLRRKKNDFIKMNKYITRFFLCVLFCLTPIIAFSQNAVAEEIVTSNGEIISRTKINKSKKSSVVSTESRIVDKFYKNQNNINVLNHLMSHHFYRKTPFFKFKEIMKEKNRVFGKFQNKSLINVSYPEKGIIILKYKVNYINRSAIEEVGLIKEDEVDSYEIISYNVH